MSIIRITEGEHTTELEGGWTVFTDEFEAYAGQNSHFTAASGTLIGNPETAPAEVSDNAYIPVVIIDESVDTFYTVETSKSTWTLSKLIEESLQKPLVNLLKFKTTDKIIPINFDVKKGNPNANDSDGGNITAISFNSKGENLGKIIFENLKYGDRFVFKWDRTKDLAQIDFYADDNDDFFDGGVENVFCGAVKLYKENCQICGDWLSILPIIPKSQHINWNSAYPGEGDKCYKLGVLQLKNFKFSPLGKQYQIAKEINHIQTFYPEELKKAVDYMKKALQESTPILCGVDDSPGTPNRDTITDHFIIIVGMGEDSKGKFFYFYDNASGDSDIGASLENKLYCKCKENKIEGEGDIRNGYIQNTPNKKYTLARVIESIKIK